jgi:hypothetical protein
MRKPLFFLFLVFFCTFLHAFAGKKVLSEEPLFQIGGGAVYSSIDLSRYTNSRQLLGVHARVVTHLGGLFFLSTEYSAFPVHSSPTVWSDVHTRKFDINLQASFSTINDRTHIFILSGIDRHEWTGIRTKYTGFDQLGDGVTEGMLVKVKRWGVNVGCGIAHTLYENIGLFADFRFNFADAHNFEKVRIMDAMSTIGANFNIPYPIRSNKVKKSGIGKKLYKWTEKGAQK